MNSTERHPLTELGFSTLAGQPSSPSRTLGVATAATPHTMTGGRFALGPGRGHGLRFQAMGLSPVTAYPADPGRVV